MRRAFLQALVILLLLLVPVGVLWMRFRMPEAAPPERAPKEDLRVTEGDSAAETTVSQPGTGVVAAPDATAPEPSWENLLITARDSRDRLAGLRTVAKSLQALDSAEAVARMLAYLVSGRDVPSGLPFALGMDGTLTTAPTLRVWLLDWLGRIDPAAAAALSAQAFAAGPVGSADEWALHLRNFAWGRPEAVDTVVAAALAMLDYPPWSRAPSIGFQEGFDVFVWGQNPEVAVRLVGLVPSSQPQALSVPANLALDRLVLNQPGAVLPRLFDHLGGLDSEPYVRAGYFARADLGEASQRALVADYFLDDRLSGGERDYFLEMIPNLNLTFSHNLLSTNPQPTYEWGNLRLDNAADMLATWLSDPRFGAWRTEIEVALARVKSAR